eukprot:scaffold3666_cov315-Pinguiococcus_pyrenoidosus.AAC.3
MSEFGNRLGEREAKKLVEAEEGSIKGNAKREGRGRKAVVKMEDQGEERRSVGKHGGDGTPLDGPLPMKRQQFEAHGSRKRQKLASTETLEHWRGLLGLIALSCQTKIVSSSNSVAEALRKMYDVHEATYSDPLEICRDFIDAYGNQALHVIRLSLQDEENPSALKTLGSLDISHISAQNDSRIRPLAGLVFDRDRSFDSKATADVLLSLVQDPARRLLLVLEKRGNAEVMVAVPWDEHDFVSRSNSFAAFLDEEALSTPMPRSIGFNASLIACFNYVPVSGREEFYLKLFRMEGCGIASLTGFALQLLESCADEIKDALVRGLPNEVSERRVDIVATAQVHGDSYAQTLREQDYAIALVDWLAENDCKAEAGVTFPMQEFDGAVTINTSFRRILRSLDARQIQSVLPHFRQIYATSRPQFPGHDPRKEEDWDEAVVREVWGWYQILSTDEEPSPKVIARTIRELDQYLYECRLLPDEVAVDMLMLRASFGLRSNFFPEQLEVPHMSIGDLLSGVILEDLTEDKALELVRLLRRRARRKAERREVGQKESLFTLIDAVVSYIVDREEQIRYRHLIGCGEDVGMIEDPEEEDNETGSFEGLVSKVNVEGLSEAEMDRLLDGLMHREQGEIFMHKLRERIGRQSEGDVRANTSNKGCGKAKNRKSRQVQMEKTAHVKGDERALWKQSKFVEMWGKSMLLRYSDLSE